MGKLINEGYYGTERTCDPGYINENCDNTLPDGESMADGIYDHEGIMHWEHRDYVPGTAADAAATVTQAPTATKSLMSTLVGGLMGGGVSEEKKETPLSKQDKLDIANGKKEG